MDDNGKPDSEACDHRCGCGHDQQDHSTSGWCNAEGEQCSLNNGHYPSECSSTFTPDPGAFDKGRLVKSNTFMMNMRPGERPRLDIKKLRPFEMIFRTVPDDELEPDDEELRGRIVTPLTPSGSKLSIPCLPVLVLADTDGFLAGEVVWLGRTVASMLERSARVLVCRGDSAPLLPITSAFIAPL